MKGIESDIRDIVLAVEGALRAGCRFFSGYPITPASEIYREMTLRLQARGDVALGAPDEISALSYCIGASQRGVKAMTATSGPGWALMVEAFQYALMAETPVVVVLVQRLGPSTGGATQGGQGDVLLAEFSTSGGYTVPVFAPSTPLECFALTIRAFNWSEVLRTPVVVLSDKEVAMTYETVDLDRLPELRIEPVDASIAQLAGSFEDSLPGDPADRIIAATALILGAVLVTADARLRSAAPVEILW